MQWTYKCHASYTNFKTRHRHKTRPNKESKAIRAKKECKAIRPICACIIREWNLDFMSSMKFQQAKKPLYIQYRIRQVLEAQEVTEDSVSSSPNLAWTSWVIQIFLSLGCREVGFIVNHGQRVECRRGKKNWKKLTSNPEVRLPRDARHFSYESNEQFEADKSMLTSLNRLKAVSKSQDQGQRQYYMLRRGAQQSRNRQLGVLLS